MRLITRAMRSMPLALALIAFTGCPDAEPITPPPDAGSGVGGNDAGSNPNVDAGGTNPDGGAVVQRLQPSNAVTAGGGKGENTNYKVRLLIGGPTAVGEGQNNTNKVKIGAGAAQHGQ